MDTQRRALLGLAPGGGAGGTDAARSDPQALFPRHPVQTHEGRTLRLYEDLLRDLVVALNFVYLNCEDGRCPITTHNLQHVQKQLKDAPGVTSSCTR